MKEIGAHLYEPYKGNDGAKLIVYQCALETECPLLKQSRCANIGYFRGTCPYGSTYSRTTKTKRSKSYRSDFQQLKEYAKSLPAIKSVEKQDFEVIGEYIYLPYSFMNHSDGQRLNIPFKNYGGVFSNGDDFMKLSDFTVQTIISILKLRPQALMGGEIKDYQEKSIPKFILALYKKMPELFIEVALQYPDIQIRLNNIMNVEIPDFEIPISLIPANIIDGYYLKSKSTRNINWDGQTLKIALPSDHLLIGIYNKKNTEIVMEYQPSDETKVYVYDSELKRMLIEKHPKYYGEKR